MASLVLGWLIIGAWAYLEISCLAAREECELSSKILGLLSLMASPSFPPPALCRRLSRGYATLCLEFSRHSLFVKY